MFMCGTTLWIATSLHSSLQMRAGEEAIFLNFELLLLSFVLSVLG